MRVGRGAVTVLVATLVCVGPGVSSVSASQRVVGEKPVRVLRIHDPRIIESSGLAASTTLPGVLWTVNDSGDEPRVYGIDESGQTVATLTLTGAPARDSEAVAVGPRAGGGSWLWVGDIGDNLSSWPSVRIYRAPEPTEAGDRDVPWTQYDLRFPDGPRDAETLLVDPKDGRVYVVSKRVQGAAIYAAPAHLSSAHVNVLTRLGPAPPLTTDGSIAADGRLVLRDYVRAYVSAGLGEPASPLALPLQIQGESVTWTPDGSAVLVGSEGADSAVWRVGVAAEETPRASIAPEPSITRSPPSSMSPAAEPAADAESDDNPALWVVLVVGLAVGAGLGLLARRASRSRRAP